MTTKNQINSMLYESKKSVVNQAPVQCVVKRESKVLRKEIQ